MKDKRFLVFSFRDLADPQGKGESAHVRHYFAGAQSPLEKLNVEVFSNDTTSYRSLLNSILRVEGKVFRHASYLPALIHFKDRGKNFTFLTPSVWVMWSPPSSSNTAFGGQSIHLSTLRPNIICIFFICLNDAGHTEALPTLIPESTKFELKK